MFDLAATCFMKEPILTVHSVGETLMELMGLSQAGWRPTPA